MPQHITHIRFFLSSPMDVTEERNATQDIIDEINQVWGKQHKTHIDLLTWDNDVYPAAGTDAQDVINTQIGDEYDIFLGIMCARFGSPTPRYGSGTEEEFERAYLRYQKKEQVQIMFYFKDGLTDLSSIDTTQLQKVREFKAKLGKSGVLYRSFKDTEQYKKLLRIHLPQICQDLQNALASPAANTKNPGKVEATLDKDALDTDELGLFDHVEAWQESIIKITDFGSAATDLMTELTAKTEVATKSIEQTPTDRAAVKKIADNIGDDMALFATKLAPLVKEFEINFSKMTDNFGKIILLSADFNSPTKEEWGTMQQSTLKLRTQNLDCVDSVAGFRDTISSLPRITKNFNKGKRESVEVLNDLFNEFNKAVVLCDEILAAINKQIEEKSKASA